MLSGADKGHKGTNMFCSLFIRSRMAGKCEPMPSERLAINRESTTYSVCTTGRSSCVSAFDALILTAHIISYIQALQ